MSKLEKSFTQSNKPGKQSSKTSETTNQIFSHNNLKNKEYYLNIYKQGVASISKFLTSELLDFMGNIVKK